jgi:hypothetical protein
MKMFNITPGRMPLKVKISIIFLFVLLILAGYDVDGQVKREKVDSTNVRDTCSLISNMLAKEYTAGHFSVLDSLLRKYNSPCFIKINKTNQRTIKNVLKVIIAQKKLDHYRVKEADSLKAKLDSIYTRFPERSDTTYYQFKFGPACSVNISKMGPPGWSTGFVLGLNFGNFLDSAWSIDIGVLYQKIPFFINAAQDPNTTRKIPAGKVDSSSFVLSTSGYSSLIEIPLRVSYNVFETDDGKFGNGVTAGAELLEMKNISVSRYLYDWDYSYTRTGPGMEQANYNNRTAPSFVGHPTFFSNKTFVNLIIGDNFYWRMSEHFLLVFSPEYHQNIGQQFVIANHFLVPPDHPYSVRPNSFMLRFSLNYLFSKVILKPE